MSKDWNTEERSVSLTNSQWSRLTTFLLMTTNYRQGELEAWEKLALEKKPDGTPVFENADNNIEYWKGMIADINFIRNTIDAGAFKIESNKTPTAKLIEAMAEYALEGAWSDSDMIDALISCGVTRDDFEQAGYGDFVKSYFEDEISLDNKLADATERSVESGKNAVDKLDVEFGKE